MNTTASRRLHESRLPRPTGRSPLRSPLRYPRRSRRFMLIALIAAATAVAACTPQLPPGEATYSVGRCAGTEGVTIVVDFAPLRDEIVVRCALGPQQNGFSVLDAARLSHDPGKYPGSVCQIEGLPTQGHPYCWSTGGYWSYWKAPSSGSQWIYSDWGASAGTSPMPGAIEGWRFAPFSAGSAKPPRIGTSGPIVP